MKRKNATRNALFTSILSLLLCVSMLVGTTFAWFTDEVVSGLNTIQAGNLDVELYAGNTQVKEDTQLFVAELWEPGMVVYENLQVRNVGTLALKYQMTLTVAGENNLNGHKLSEVVKIAVVDEIAPGATRQEVLAAAKASDNIGTIGNFFAKGELEAGEYSDVEALVVFWEPNDNATDNLYNANNGQQTSDGQPLYIEFGVNLQATQLMHEFDSFGNDYDEFATLLPKAKVLDLGAKTVNATTNGWGSGEEVTAYNVPFVLKFEPNESLEEAKLSAYKYWHADFVAKADRDVPAESLALIGYYQAFCGPEYPAGSGFDSYNVNNGNWVALTAGETITAGTEVRLVDTMGGGDGSGNGAIKVTYKDICEYANDGVGFLCAATDLTGENAGTTLTVELRMYANESDPSNSSYNGGDETGVYYVIGTYTYTFPMVERDNVIYVRSAAELENAVNTAADESVIAFASNIEGDVVLTQRPGIDLTVNGCGKSYTGRMVVYGDGNYSGAESLAIKDIKFIAKAGAGECIVSPDKSVNNKYSYAHNITVEGCTFTDPDGTVNCAAIRHEDGGDRNWTVRACAVDSTMHSLLQVNNVHESLIVDGCDLNSKNGINLNSTQNITVKNCFFNVKGYCVRLGQSGGAPEAIKNYYFASNTFKTAGDDGAAIVFRGDAVTNSTLTLDGNSFVGCEKVTGATSDTTIIEQ